MCFALDVKPIYIDDLDDPRIADYRDVRDADLRRQRGLFMAEGRFVVDLLLGRRSTRVADSLFLNPKSLEALSGALSEARSELPVYVAKQELFNDVVGFNMHRGCLAVGRVGDPVKPGVLLESAGEPSLLVVVECLRNTENLGGIFRNAMAFGADGVLLCPQTCDPLYRKAIRVSMGGSLCVPFARFDSWPEPLQELRSAGYQVLALDLADDALSLSDLGTRVPLANRVALLLGTEGRGVSEDALSQVDGSVRIPMAPGVDSLNVSTAAGIAIHHVYAHQQSATPTPETET